MKILSCSAQNFGSYKTFAMDFHNQGLSLIYGKTGSGKSTIPDIACWALFGVTARGGAVDDIKSWTSDNEPTTVELEVETQNGTITVVRTRGSTKQNDLYWIEHSNSDPDNRGKDLQDTQKKLVARLGVDLDTFVTSAYFHEFSEAGNFFVLRAKERRAIFERLANLDLPARLAEAASIRRKSAKVELADKEKLVSKALGKFEQLVEVHNTQLKRSQEWVDKQEAGAETLKNQLENLKAAILFKKSETKNIDRLISLKEEVSQSITNVSSLRCSECGGPKKSILHAELQNELAQVISEINETKLNKAEIHRMIADSDRIKAEIVKIESQSENPWKVSLEQLEYDIDDADGAHSVVEGEKWRVENFIQDLDQLYDLSSTLRGELLRRTISQIEQETNRYLETYFDAEIKVEFTIDTQKDDLGVLIKKSGYEANYTQLSKGQRSLLRLCFSVAVMQQASNKSGVHQDCLFFDEFTDGLDEGMKEKVFGLLSELETKHGSVFVIDHSPGFQNMFNKKLLVTMEGDESNVEFEDFG